MGRLRTNVLGVDVEHENLATDQTFCISHSTVQFCVMVMFGVSMESQGAALTYGIAVAGAGSV